MKQKLLTILLSMIMVFSAPIYANEKEKEPIPGRAIFVMAPDYPIHVQSKNITAQENYLHVNMKTPQIKGLKNRSFEKELNKKLLEDAKLSQNKMSQSATAARKQSKNVGSQLKSYELIRDFTIKATAEPYVVIGIFEYRYTGGTHGMAQQKYVVIDKDRQKLIELKDLFKEGVDYETVLAGEIIKQIPHKKASGVVFVEQAGGLEKVAHDQNFYINEKGELVLVFNIYEVSPYVSGTIEFVIPKENIKNIRVNEKVGA
ncbi:MAG: DUF3298 and DUF4163 domain-containing protein [Cellulosilyticaceae bacterium]